MIVTIAQTEALSEATRAAIIHVCIAAHQEEDFNHLFTYIPSGGRHFLAYDDGELISHVVVTTRWIQPENQPILKTAYVDAVATSPAYQGLGYGTAVMHHLAQNLPDYDIACLETDRPAFYQRLGWEQWRGSLAGRNEQGIIPTPDQQGIMILRLERTPSLNLDSALTIECDGGRIW